MTAPDQRPKGTGARSTHFDRARAHQPPTDSAAPVSFPFPQQFAKKVKDDRHKKFIDHMKRVEINLPFIEAIQEMSGYAKFLKDMVSQKRKFEANEIINLFEECSAIIQKKMSIKRQDPGCFNITCVIGGQIFGKVLCDSGASINLMPLSIFKRLEIGTIKPTSITLQMADRSVTYPKGIVEDVLIKVNDFIFPVDFVVLDMEEDANIPLILGHPFLATGDALIDVRKGELTLRVNDEKITFSIYKAMKQHDTEECRMLQSSISSLENSLLSTSSHDSLEKCIQHSVHSSQDLYDVCDELLEYALALDSTQELDSKRVVNYLKLRSIDSTQKGPRTLELKPLPEH